MSESSNTILLKQRLQLINNKKNYNLVRVPKVFNQMLCFMDSNIRKQFRSFSLLVLCGTSDKAKFIVNQNLEKTFNQMTVKEKLDSYEKAVNIAEYLMNSQKDKQDIQNQINQELKSVYNNMSNTKNNNNNMNNTKDNNNNMSNINNNINNNTSSTIQMYLTLHSGFKSSQQIKILLQSFKLSCKKPLLSIDLQNYLFRVSKKKNPQCYILSSINSSQPQILRFSFANLQEEQYNISILKRLIEIGFKNTIKNMLLTEKNAVDIMGYNNNNNNNNNSNGFNNNKNNNHHFNSSSNGFHKSEHHHKELDRSYGRLRQTQKYIQQTPIKNINDTQILKDSSKRLLQYSNQLADKNRINNINKTTEQLIQDLLSSSRNHGDKNKNIKNVNNINNININNNINNNDNNNNDNDNNNDDNDNVNNNHVPVNIYNQILQAQPYIKQSMRSVSLVKSYTSLKPMTTFSPKRYRNIFEQILPSYSLRQIQNSRNFSKQIWKSNVVDMMIYQHSVNRERYKMRLVVNNLMGNNIKNNINNNNMKNSIINSNINNSIIKTNTLLPSSQINTIDEIYKLLINTQLLKKWNRHVDDSQIKITLTDDNCLICYQKHHQLYNFFKPRDYLYLRHGFTYKNNKYICDKSIQHTSFIPFLSIQRGNIQHIVTRIKQLEDKSGKVEVIVDLMVRQQGYLGEQKRREIIMKYLIEYQNIEKYLKDIISIPQSHGETYVHLNWNIDWIDNNNNKSYRSFKSSKTLRNQQFDEQSYIDNDHMNIQIQQSEQFYSVLDVNQNYQQNQNNQQQNQLEQQQQQQQRIQIEENQNYKSHNSINNIYNNKNNAINAVSQITLDQQGYCILPVKYIKSRHLITPSKLSLSQTPVKKYQNIVFKQDFIYDQQGGLKLVNRSKIQSQDNVLSFIMKTMKKNLFTGKSILSISLPVEIFKQDSNTQRLCESMGLAPKFLERAYNMKNNPLQRMKYAIAFGLSNSILYFYIEKPFNPILGETYQGLINGCPVYAEQISHHPPISSILFVGRGYRVYANLQSKVSLHLNSGDGVNEGYYHIEFQDDRSVIKFQTAPGEVSGFTIGDRKFRYKDKMFIIDQKHLLYSQLLFQQPNLGIFSKKTWKYGDQMGGFIYKVTPQFMNRFISSKQRPSLKQKDIVQKYSQIHGRWIYELFFDNVKYYDILQDIPYQMYNYQQPLHSDARYREDLIYRTRNDLVKSQIHKEYLQNKQRKDRKLRENYSGNKKH